jgi:hypothetical protein
LNPEKISRLRWELGSEFHWMGLPEKPLLPWPSGSVWFMLARHAVAALVRMHVSDGFTLWLPSYFCPEVAECCGQYCPIRQYRDLPTWHEPDWKSLQPRRNDMVLAVNYFGVREFGVWRRWRESTPCVLIEDHTHDPGSEWVLSSTAEYALASIRKTLPVADGAILWSPRGLSLPEQSLVNDWSGPALKLAAMIYKHEYLSGAETAGLKDRFRRLQLDGEKMLRGSEISAISPGSLAYLSEGAPISWRQQRATNARRLVDNLAVQQDIKCLFTAWSEGAVPFVVPLLFDSRNERDVYQSQLQQENIYCPVHWVCQTEDLHALELSEKILSLPIDQRYTEEDMDRISNAILKVRVAACKDGI